MICGNAFPQSVRFSLDLPDLKEWDRQTQEYPLIKKLVDSQATTISELEKSLAIAQKERDLEKRENELNLRIIEIKDKEIAAINRNFDQMKEVADRSLKLVEVSKPKSNWELLGGFGLVAIIVTVIAAAF
jgi:RNA polymerase-interacting CarD/CdnL/TRCF family regulator